MSIPVRKPAPTKRGLLLLRNVEYPCPMHVRKPAPTKRGLLPSRVFLVDSEGNVRKPAPTKRGLLLVWINFNYVLHLLSQKTGPD